MTEGIIYLDYNATTPLLPEVVDAMLPFLRDHFGNPSSSHVVGRAAHEAVEHARAQVAALIGRPRRCSGRPPRRRARPRDVDRLSEPPELQPGGVLEDHPARPDSQRLEEGGCQRAVFKRPLSRIASMSRSRASRSQPPSSAIAAMMQSPAERTVLPFSRKVRYSFAALR